MRPREVEGTANEDSASLSQKDSMRELTVNEIAQLEERGCWAEDWSDILVEEGFAPSQMENVLLYGHVEVGSLNGSVEMEEGFRRRCCLRNAVLRNVTVGDDCLIENVRGYISNYQIGDRCYIANVGVMTSQEGSTFGNVHHTGEQLLHLVNLGGADLVLDDCVILHHVGGGSAGIGVGIVDTGGIDHMLTQVVHTNVHELDGVQS